MGPRNERRSTANARSRVQLRGHADSALGVPHVHDQLLTGGETIMKLNTRITSTIARVAAAIVFATMGACKLDITNPNAATEEGVLTSVAGIRALTIGIQGRYGNAMEENITIPGLISGELGNTSSTQSTTREFQRFPTVNSAIEETNVDLLDVWVKNYAVIKVANDILDKIGRASCRERRYRAWVTVVL